ncbi:MAG: hypothetical protein LC799_22520, partial [Actinobacteria bacterium]|nr:hypothetical protein [Actinomycetota bacterium]
GYISSSRSLIKPGHRAVAALSVRSATLLGCLIKQQRYLVVEVMVGLLRSAAPVSRSTAASGR